MKSLVTLSFFIVVAFMTLAGCSESPDAPRVSNAPPVSECSKAQLVGYAPPVAEQRSHRLFAEPTITYPYGLDQEKTWGFTVAAKVDESGRVVCYTAGALWLDDPVESNEQRRRLLAEVGQWRYQPFLKDGKPTAAIVREGVYEQEAPEAHRPLPAVPLDQVQISLERTVCFGSCASYVVDIHGDGRVVYTGRAFVDVVGEHTYRIPPQRVAKLVESLRAKDLWSLREQYRAQVTDNPAYILKLQFGDQVRELVDYVGASTGMPRVVTEFEKEIDEAAGVRDLIGLSAEGLKLLEASGFRFRSQDGADLLSIAVANHRAQDDHALLRLIELGAPIVGARGDWVDPSPLLELAMRNRRVALIELLIQQGALETDGSLDQAKIDGAFRAAVAGGRLAQVEKIWALAGEQHRPSLVFEQVLGDPKTVKKSVPVTFLVERWYRETAASETVAIVKWLAARGCDLKAKAADGYTTLADFASANQDEELVRYLASQGVDRH